MPYQWTTDDDEVALDAIIVGIGSDEKAFTAAGIEFGEVLASIYPEALERAETLCALWAFKRVIIAIQDRSIWQPEWGELAEMEGLD